MKNITIIIQNNIHKDLFNLRFYQMISLIEDIKINMYNKKIKKTKMNIKFLKVGYKEANHISKKNEIYYNINFIIIKKTFV